MSDEIEDAIFEEIDNNELEESTRAHLKDERKQHYIKLIEKDLKKSLTEASVVQKKITDAKTFAKKDFYKKKFYKISNQVKQYINALQQLGANLQSEGTEDNVITDAIPTTEQHKLAYFNV